MDKANTKERYICLMDIMGFKDFNYRNPHDKVVETLREITSLASFYKNFTIEHANSETAKIVPHVLVFSDTILLISKDNGEDDMKYILLASQAILTTCLAKGIPIKGAMAYGQITYEPEESLIAGIPLIDAHLLAEDVKFYGVVMHSTVERKIHENNWISNLGDSYAKIPFQKGIASHYFIPIKQFLIMSTLQTYEETRALLLKLNHTVSGSTRQYVDNTIDLYGFRPEKETN